MRVDRLKMLCDVLSKVPEKRFRMHAWWYEGECGTAGCMGGWACQIPEFKEAGLVLDRNMLPVYQDKIGYEAIALFLELSPLQCLYLCDPNKYSLLSSVWSGITPQLVMARIEELLANEEANQCAPTG